jgi:hypothetical protein
VHHATQFLAFAKSADMDRGVQALRPTSVMGHAKATSSFQLLSTYDWDHDARVATFLPPNDRAREFRDNFEVSVVDCACWRLFSRGMSCTFRGSRVMLRSGCSTQSLFVPTWWTSATPTAGTRLRGSESRGAGRRLRRAHCGLQRARRHGHAHEPDGGHDGEHHAWDAAYARHGQWRHGGHAADDHDAGVDGATLTRSVSQ